MCFSLSPNITINMHGCNTNVEVEFMLDFRQKWQGCIFETGLGYAILCWT